MTPSSKAGNQQPRPAIKAVSLRWPEDFWEAVSIAATKRRTSVQVLVTEAVAAYLGIPAPGTSLDTSARPEAEPRTDAANNKKSKSAA